MKKTVIKVDLEKISVNDLYEGKYLLLVVWENDIANDGGNYINITQLSPKKKKKYIFVGNEYKPMYEAKR